MEKLKKNKFLYIIVFGLIVGVVGMIIYPIFDLIICKIFTNTKFVWNVYNYIIKPLEFGMIFSIVYCLLFEFQFS